MALDVNIQKKLPAMAWIHGGSPITGSNNFDEAGPGYIIDEDVILVTVNYRLGPFGFLFMGDDNVSGNAGLKDQVMALEWVQENIANFGGDPDTVTIFGESAGSFSVSVHLLSPLSVDLFHRAIMQSRSAIGPGWNPVTPETGKLCAARLAEKLECSEEKDILNCLEGREMEEILVHTYDLGITTCWMAVPDIDYSSEPFLIGDPEEIMSSGNFNTDVEIIIGTNKDEGILSFFDQLRDPTKWDILRENWDTQGPMMLFD